MSLDRTAIEIGAAVVIAIVLFALQPGVAVGGLIALVLLLVVGASLLPRLRQRRRLSTRALRRASARNARPRRTRAR